MAAAGAQGRTLGHQGRHVVIDRLNQRGHEQSPVKRRRCVIAVLSGGVLQYQRREAFEHQFDLLAQAIPLQRLQHLGPGERRFGQGRQDGYVLGKLQGGRLYSVSFAGDVTADFLPYQANNFCPLAAYVDPVRNPARRAAVLPRSHHRRRPRARYTRTRVRRPRGK